MNRMDVGWHPRFALVALLLVETLVVSVHGQSAAPPATFRLVVGQVPSNVSEQRRQIDQVYDYAGRASGLPELNQALNMCSQLKQSGLPAEYARYVDQLTAWLLNRRGEQLVRQASQIQSQGNANQSQQLEQSACRTLPRRCNLILNGAPTTTEVWVWRCWAIRRKRSRNSPGPFKPTLNRSVRGSILPNCCWMPAGRSERSKSIRRSCRWIRPMRPLDWDEPMPGSTKSDTRRHCRILTRCCTRAAECDRLRRSGGSAGLSGAMGGRGTGLYDGDQSRSVVGPSLPECRLADGNLSGRPIPGSGNGAARRSGR